MGTTTTKRTSQNLEYSKRFRIDEQTLSRLEQIAFDHGLNISAMLRLLVNEEWERVKRNGQNGA